MKRKIIALFMVISIIIPIMNVLPVRAYNDPADIDNVELMQTKDDDFIINPISDVGDTIENIADDTDIDEQFESNEDTVNGIIDKSDSGVSLFASYETITCARRVTIPANMEVRLYSSATSTSVTSDYYPAESSSWTLYSDSFVNFSDGTASRFHITTGQGASRWFVYYKGMSYTTLHTVQGYKSAHPHYGYCDCGATVSSSTRKNSSCTTCYPPHVYYYTNGGSGGPSSQSGYPITISSTIPTKFPYMFEGWGTSSSATSAYWYPGESMYKSAGSSTSLYAVWKSPTTLNTSSQTTSSVYIGSKGAIGYFKFIPTVTATYSFESTASTDTYGYLYNSSGSQLDYNDDGGDGSNFKLTYAMTAGTTYYFGVKHYSSSSTGTIPVKLRRQYNISYNANNGIGAPSSQTKLYGETLTLSSSRPTREGCTFLGWATSSGATEPEYDPGDSFTLNDDYTLYAVWDVPSYTITFDANNGDNAPSPQTKSYGETITLSEDMPTRSEYKFLGWATSPEATSAEYLPGSSFSLNENCVLYAVWLEYDYTGTPMISVEDDYDKKTVTMSSTTDNAVIYYTTDGSEPSEAGEVYTEPIIITNEGSITFKAIAVAAGYKDSAVSENEVVLSKLSAPEASVPSGNVKEGTEIELSGSGEIYYTINKDGEQSEEQSEEQLYTSPIIADGEITINAYAKAVGFLRSDNAEYSYTIKKDTSGTIDSVTWNFVDGELIVSGTGAIPDVEKEDAPWYPLHDEIVKITIEETINTIGRNVFSGLENAETVTIPDSVTQINDGAFEGCTALQTVDLPENMTGGIGENAFKDCIGITSVAVPTNVSSIGNGAFKGCELLTEITVPFIGSQVGSSNNTDTFDYIFNGSVPETLVKVTVTNETDVPENAFAHLAHLQTIVINDGINTIGNGAFDTCSTLGEFVVPEGISAIGDNTFRNCANAVKIDIPDTVQSIGEAAFDGCAKLMAINIPDGINAIYKYTFRNCSSLTDIVIPNSVSAIENDVLMGCVSLRTMKVPFVGANANPGSKEVTSQGIMGYFFGTEDNSLIPPSVTKVEITNTDRAYYIPKEAFKNCGNIEDIIINGGGTILDYAFANCKMLKHLYIPRSISVIGKKILEDCMQIKTLTIPFVGTNRNDKNTETSVLGGFFGNDDDDITGTIQYYNDNGGYHYYKIPQTLKNVSILNQTSIPAGAFMECDFIEKISVVTGKGMGDQAFYHCASLKEVSLPNDLTVIGSEAFAECESLETINIPTEVKSIGDNAFYNARNLKNVTIPDSVTEIADDVFNGTNLFGEKVQLLSGGAITCSMDSAAYKYAVSKNIPTNIVDSAALNVKKTSTTVELLSDNSYLFDITDTHTMRGVLHVELYDTNANFLKDATRKANDVEYRIEFSNEEMQNVSFAKIYISEETGEPVSTEDEVISVDGGEIPAMPDSDIVMHYENGIISFTGNTPLRDGAILIQAVYNEDTSLDIVHIYPVTGIGNQIEVDTDFSTGAAKFMLWGSFDTMEPLADAITE